MTTESSPNPEQRPTSQSSTSPGLGRRQMLAYAAFGGAAAAMAGGMQQVLAADDAAAKAPAKRKYKMKKSINLWAFPYPQKMTLTQCLQLAKDAGFDGIELNYDLESDLSPKSGTKEFTEIRKTAEKIGIAISGVCSFLFWPYPLTSNDPAERARGLELAGMMTQAAHDLGTENLLVVPGAVCMPWRKDHDPTPNDVCDKRARESVRKLLPGAEKLKVSLNMENIFFNGFLLSPMEIVEFVDSFQSEYVKVHFDTGNIMEYQYPEHWIPIVGKRIKNVHLKEFTKKGTDHSLETFRPLLDGTTNWPAVIDAFANIGYDQYLTFEYFHPYQHYPEALVYQTADSLDRMLGIKYGMAIELTTLFLSLALLIGVARLLGEIARRFHQPAILGELLAGVLLGPTVFGAIAPQWQAILFPTTGANAVVMQGIGSLAIVLFMLVSGMEVDLSAVWKQGRAALKVGALGTFIPFLLGLLAAMFAPQAFGRHEGADPMVFSLFLATAMAISALPVIAKTLMDLDLYRTDLGMIVISAAIFDDLIGWTIFALILGMMGTHGEGHSVAVTLVLTLVYAGTMLTAGRWLMHRVLPFLQAYTHSPGGVLGFAATAALCGAALTEWIGVHAIFGAFLVGVALGDSTHLQERTRVIVDQFISFIFAPLFFATLGLKMNFIAEFQPGLVLSIVFLACVGKLIGATWGARWGGFPARDSWAIGFAMNARGAMEIILGTLALNAKIIEKPLFVALVVMAIFTSAISGPLMRRILRRQQPHRILSYVAGKLFLPNMAAESRLEAIRELAAAAAQHAGLDAAEIERQAWAREQVTATGIGNGVAIPNARLPDLKEPVVVVGVSEAGVPFDAPDGQPAHVMFLVVTPQEDSSVLLELSADIAQLYREPRCLERTQRAANITELLAVFKTTVRK